MRNTETQLLTPSRERLNQEINHFIDDIPAPDASDCILRLMFAAGDRDPLDPELTKALHSVIFLINAIDRVQREVLHA